MTKTSSRASQGWTHYWREGWAASCAPDSKRAAREIRERWMQWFAELPDGSRVLDLGTGNGILLAHAVAAAQQQGKRFYLTGVDLADIDPVRWLSSLPSGLRRARFLGGVAAEQLPLAAGEFDAAVSQYGLEYAALEPALAEVERILAPGGKLFWLAHAEDSSVVRQNRSQGEQAAYLLAPGSPLHAMRRFVAERRRGRAPKRTAKELAAALAKAEQYCNDRPPAAVVREVCTVIAETAQRWQAYRLEDLDRMLSDSRARLQAHRQRMSDLAAAVLSPVRLAAVRRRLQPPAWQEASMAELRVGASASSVGLLIAAQRAFPPS